MYKLRLTIRNQHCRTHYINSEGNKRKLNVEQYQPVIWAHSWSTIERKVYCCHSFVEIGAFKLNWCRCVAIIKWMAPYWVVLSVSFWKAISSSISSSSGPCVKFILCNILPLQFFTSHVAWRIMARSSIKPVDSSANFFLICSFNPFANH